MRWYPSKTQLAQSWEKYGLIVVGNIVFFTLLYFISYRPHNEENRASEFLSLAQQAEADSRYDAAKVIYQKVAADYADTRSAETATLRLKFLKRRQPAPVKPKPEKLAPIIDIGKMLDQRPAVYVARYLAEHYDDTPDLRPRVRDAIADYLRIAINYEGVSLKTLRTEKEFQRKAFQKAFFSIRSRCEMKSDWIYDDFFIRNTSIFPWHNVRLHITVSQGDKKKSADVRIPSLRPGRSFEVVSLNVDKNGGDVTCQGVLKMKEGTTKFKHGL